MISMTWPQSLRHEATIDGRRVHFPPGQCALLEVLLLNPPWRFVEGDEMIEAIWPDPDLQPLGARGVVSVYACHLRRAGVPIEDRNPFGCGRGRFAAYRVPASARGETPRQASA
jgi:DNA-binding response OmpR family regulator